MLGLLHVLVCGSGSTVSFFFFSVFFGEHDEIGFTVGFPNCIKKTNIYNKNFYFHISVAILKQSFIK